MLLFSSPSRMLRLWEAKAQPCCDYCDYVCIQDQGAKGQRERKKCSLPFLGIIVSSHKEEGVPLFKFWLLQAPISASSAACTVFLGVWSVKKWMNSKRRKKKDDYFCSFSLNVWEFVFLLFQRNEKELYASVATFESQITLRSIRLRETRRKLVASSELLRILLPKSACCSLFF